jgi:hypothetical protein
MDTLVSGQAVRDNASPEELVAVQRIFDDTCRHFDLSPAQVRRREDIAQTIFRIWREGVRDESVLRQAAFHAAHVV